MKKQIIFPVLVILALIGAGIIGVTSVKAQTTVNPGSNLVRMLADKFGLSRTDVQTVFDQFHQNQKTDREQAYLQMLTQAVTDGKITDAQKQLLLAKHNELEANHQANRENLKTWASQNNIDLKYLFGGFGHGPRGMRGGWGTPLPTPTP